MKRLIEEIVIITLVAVAVLFSCDVKAEPLWEEADKQKHMVVSAVGATAIYELGDGRLTRTEAFAIMVGIGLAKELIDGDKNTLQEHKRDLAADAIGSAFVFTWKVEF